MRSKLGKHTPRESALVIVMEWIRAVHAGKTADLLDVDDRDSYRVQVRSALAKEHNRLARRVKSYDVELDEDEVFLPPAVSSTNKYNGGEDG